MSNGFAASPPGPTQQSVCLRIETESATRSLSAAFEELHGSLVLLGRGSRTKRSEIAPAAGLWILLARVQPVSAILEFSNHRSLQQNEYVWRDRGRHSRHGVVISLARGVHRVFGPSRACFG